MSGPKVCKASLRAALGRPATRMPVPSHVARTSRFFPHGNAGAPRGMPGFLLEIRRMCQLIEEAGRYGATEGMEREYRALRSSLAHAYRSLKDELDGRPFGGPGFHGCNFELMFANYSLDLLVRGPGERTIEMLTEIWRTEQRAESEAV